MFSSTQIFARRKLSCIQDLLADPRKEKQKRRKYLPAKIFSQWSRNQTTLARVFRNRDKFNSPWGNLKNGARQQWNGEASRRRWQHGSRRAAWWRWISKMFSERPKGRLPGYTLQMRRLRTKRRVPVPQRYCRNWLKRKQWAEDVILGVILITRANCLLERLQNLTNVIYFWIVWSKPCVWTRHLFREDPSSVFKPSRWKPGNSRGVNCEVLISQKIRRRNNLSSLLSNLYLRITERNGVIRICFHRFSGAGDDCLKMFQHPYSWCGYQTLQDTFYKLLFIATENKLFLPAKCKTFLTFRQHVSEIFTVMLIIQRSFVNGFAV